MLIGLIADTHYGIRNDSSVFYSYQSKSNEFFLDEFKKRGVTNIIHLGDLFDRKKYINYITLNQCRLNFLNKIKTMGFTMDIIAGNHDIYHKNTHDVNSLRELIAGRYDNIDIYSVATVKNYDGLDILLIPWICDTNKDVALYKIQNTSASIAFGHLELNGFQMYKDTTLMDHGYDKKLFDGFDLIASGHFHHKSTVGNINYLGAAYEFVWSDFNDPRGVHVFDTNTRSLEFIQNPYSMFHMELYDDSDPEIINDLIKTKDYSYLKDAYVKMVVMKKNNPYLFDVLMDKIYAVSPTDITIVEDMTQFTDNEEENSVNESEDTLTILSKYIDGLQMVVDPDKMKAHMREIYMESIALEETLDG